MSPWLSTSPREYGRRRQSPSVDSIDVELPDMNVARYLARIGYSGPTEPNSRVLADLMRRTSSAYRSRTSMSTWESPSTLLKRPRMTRLFFAVGEGSVMSSTGCSPGCWRSSGSRSIGCRPWCIARTAPWVQTTVTWRCSCTWMKVSWSTSGLGRATAAPFGGDSTPSTSSVLGQGPNSGVAADVDVRW